MGTKKYKISFNDPWESSEWVGGVGWVGRVGNKPTTYIQLTVAGYINGCHVFVTPCTPVQQTSMNVMKLCCINI